MDKTIKSFVGNIIILFIYLYATEGIVKLCSNNNTRRPFYILLLSTLLGIVLFILIVASYHMFRPDIVTIIYKSIICFCFIYLIVGCVVNFLIKR
jgi:hypothetical protein